MRTLGTESVQITTGQRIVLNIAFTILTKRIRFIQNTQRNNNYFYD